MWIGQARLLFRGTPVLRTDLRLVTFCKTEVNVIGFITVNVNYENFMFKLNLYLMNLEQPPLLGHDWIRAIIEKRGASSLFSTVNLVDSNDFDKNQYIKKLLDTYGNVTSKNLTKMNKLKASLSLKPDTKPVFLKPRPLPFKLIPLIEKEFDLLIADNVLEKVDASG